MGEKRYKVVIKYTDSSPEYDSGWFQNYNIVSELFDELASGNPKYIRLLDELGNVLIEREEV